jgi:hypothetical protein
MTINIGITDRGIRALVGLTLLGLVYIVPGEIRWIGLIGFVPLVTAAFGSCPLYKQLGISTAQKK